MKKIFRSSALVLVVAAIAGYATYSFFSDTETSTGNTFTAGAIDLTVTHTDKATNGACQFSNTVAGPIFYCTDVKPGDSGESTLKFNLTSNPAWACVQVNNVVDSDNECNDPELAAESVCTQNGNGELDQHLNLTIWIDDGAGAGESCDNDQSGTEQVLANNVPLSTFMTQVGNQTSFVLPVADTTDQSMLGKNHALPVGEQCLGIAWSVPTTTGNEVQTDKLGGDLVFYVEQERNNSDFSCATHFAPLQGTQTLTLENETQNATGPWTPITNDAKSATLTWQGDGPTFNYTLTAQSLPINTPYSLIYYADPFPGNNPGKLIGTYTTDGSGGINSGAQVIDLGMDLPAPADANFGTGAKIWLIPSANYTGTSVSPWAPDDNWLFEGNVYIHYNDTDN